MTTKKKPVVQESGECSVAAQTIQPHILYSRPATRELVRTLLGSGVQSSQRRKPFNFSMEDGQVFLDLDAPMKGRDMASYQTPISASIQAQREALMRPITERLQDAREKVKLARGAEAKQAARREVESIAEELRQAGSYLPSEVPPATKEQLARYIAKVKKRDKGETKAFESSFSETGERLEQQPASGDQKAKRSFSIGRVGLLTLTSKMGCYSFNLPAGPLTHGFYGTCPASRFGFPMLSDTERTRSGQSEAFSKLKLNKHDWLCSGCYGLKGLYGNPSMVFVMECRKQFIEGQIALDKYTGRDDLVAFMVRSIRMGQVKSITERFFLEEMGLQEDAWAIPDPAYFRWHDVGDAWLEAWQRAIFRICEAMAEPWEHKDLGLHLPGVHFWQPTRMWALKGGPLYKAAEEGRIPKNLSIRPSAAHFNEPPPVIPGLSAGAGSICMQEEVTPADRAKVEGIAGSRLYPDGKTWICPAYLRPEFDNGKRVGGGGALIRKKTLKGGTVKEELVGGACGRAYGPDGQQPSPHGSGCRVCWDRPDLIVIYPEH